MLSKPYSLTIIFIQLSVQASLFSSMYMYNTNFKGSVTCDWHCINSWIKIVLNYHNKLGGKQKFFVYNFKDLAATWVLWLCKGILNDNVYMKESSK